MGLNPNSDLRFNLSNSSILLMDGTPMGLSILSQIITGLGGRRIHRTAALQEAQEVAKGNILDLVIVDADENGYEFVEWLRRNGGDPNCYAPVLLIAGHTPASHVHRARDCGAHFTLKKPLAPIALLERIIWIAREGRLFLASDTYVGPDRRFKNVGAPDGKGRRREDQAAETSHAETAP